MKHITEKNINLPYPTAVAVGQFDTLHRGHMSLIKTMAVRAMKRGLKTVVFSFYPAPFEVFGEKRDYTFTGEEKIDILSDSGFDIDYFVEYPFDQAFAKTDPQDFLYNFLLKRLNVKLFAAGEGYRFGRNRAGDVSMIKKASRNTGFNYYISEDICENGVIISSGNIRKAIADNNFITAKHLMGRAFFIKGIVEEGKHFGAKLGFPTLNMSIPAGKLCPADGVYITACETREGAYHPAVTNIGDNPSFENVNRRIETHLIDYDDNLYGECVKIHFYKHIRSEMVFNDKVSLVKQINADAAVSREWWAKNG